MRIEVDDTYLTNIPKGHRVPPHGEPWEAYLFCRRVVRGHSKRYVETLRADTKRGLTNKIRRFVKAKHTHLLAEQR